MTVEEKAAEVPREKLGDGFFAGPETSLLAVRDKAKDNADGTVTIAFLVDAADLPKDFVSSPIHSAWSLFLRGRTREHRLTATREVLQDKDRGKVMLRFAVFASSHQPEAVYGNKGEEVMLTMNLIAKENNHPFMATAASRFSVMQRCAMMCDEPAFAQWIADQCRRDGYPTLDAPPRGPAAEAAVDEDAGPPSATMRAVEHLYRVAQVHSRADVLDNNAAAGRVEDVMRRYRAHLWDARNRNRRSGRTG